MLFIFKCKNSLVGLLELMVLVKMPVLSATVMDADGPASREKEQKTAGNIPRYLLELSLAAFLAVCTTPWSP